MQQYQSFAKFYDQSMGDRTKMIKLVEGFIKKYHPSAKTVFELAVGTGSILEPLSKRYAVSGLDISEPMLKIAKIKVPKARLYNQNMIDFKTKDRFDVIICIFDSINHVLKFSNWEKIFENTHKHLNKNGIFIFDINSQYMLKNKLYCEPFVQKMEKGVRLVDTENKGHGMVDFIIYILNRTSNGKHELIEDHAIEISFPIVKIKKSLLKYFKQVDCFDRDLKKPNKTSSRIYFICRA